MIYNQRVIKTILLLSFLLFGLLTYASSANLPAKKNNIISQILQPFVAVGDTPPFGGGGLQDDNAPFPFRLLGTLMESEPNKSIAVIKDLKSGRQSNYKIADNISGYKIIKIVRAKVALLRNGKYFLLELPLGNENTPLVTVVSADMRIVYRELIGQKTANLNALMKQVTSIPYVESGKFVGFKITKVKDSALGNMTGVKEGDVITQINGQRLDTLRKPFEIYRAIRNQDKINLELKRGEQIKNLIYYIN